MPPRPRSHDKPIKQRHEPRFTKTRRGQSKIKRQMAAASRRRNRGAK